MVDYKSCSDDELVVLVRRGDPWAFDEIVARYHQRVVAYCYSILHDHDEAEDTAQETYVHAFQAMIGGRYREQGTFNSWLFTIARRVCMDRIKKKGGRREQSLDEMIQAGRDLEGDPSPESVVIGDDLTWCVRTALASLTEEERLLLSLKYEQGFTTEEIAAILGVSAGTANSRLNRARIRLAAAMRRACPEIIVGLETNRERDRRGRAGTEPGGMNEAAPAGARERDDHD